MAGTPMERLKLFVVGESCPYPGEWETGYSAPSRSIVIARDEIEAANLAADVGGPVAEISMESPVVVMHDLLRPDGL